jgi:beta-glucosidase
LVLGVGGEKTENILWRLQNGALEGVKARVAVVLAGTNNLAGVPGEQPAWVAGGVAAIVTTIRERLPGCRVLVLGILPRGREATDPFRAKIAEVNTHLATLADGKEVFYEDLASAFLNPDGRLPPETFPDALHPNGAGYERFVAALEPILKRME